MRAPWRAPGPRRRRDIVPAGSAVRAAWPSRWRGWRWPCWNREAPDSLAAWGGFANAFEAKEYMEPYVAEQVAREQLAASPALREEFAARLQSDPALAASPRQRLDFFYRRSPSWDERYRLYPVLRVDTRP